MGEVWNILNRLLSDSIYLLSSKNFATMATWRNDFSSLFRIHSVLKNFHSGERIKKIVDLYTGFTGYVWKEAVSRKTVAESKMSGYVWTSVWPREHPTYQLVLPPAPSPMLWIADLKM